MMTSTIPITLIETLTKIEPSQNPELPDPVGCDAVYNTTNKTLEYTCTIQIPVEVDINDVKGYQYYSSDNENTLEIYFVYDYTRSLSGDYNTYDVSVVALDTIDLTKIENIFNLIENIDPKTSRGTVTTVRSTGNS